MLWHVEVFSLHDIMLLLHTYFTSEAGKREKELWGEEASFDIYLDGNLIGDYCNGEITIDPITDYREVQRNGKTEIGYTFRHGNQGYIIPIETCLHYGINQRTVKLDDKHRW
jgi:hypothetical protein